MEGSSNNHYGVNASGDPAQPVDPLGIVKEEPCDADDTQNYTRDPVIALQEASSSIGSNRDPLADEASTGAIGITLARYTSPEIGIATEIRKMLISFYHHVER
uniref:Uncharacterized protein n=1 Tax=Anopheles culicifacies TaxID=139723 RepID=A0A182M5A9_9DIPT